MNRTIDSQPAVSEEVKTDSVSDLRVWLESQAKAHSLKWLLAHADDGVIWGLVDNGKLITSDAVLPDVSPPLRAETLQQARLFSESGELLLWRNGDKRWHARLIREIQDSDKSDWDEAIDEPQILWGTDAQPLNDGFTLMSDGSQGLRHAVPIPVNGNYNGQTRPLRLWVRHYLKDDDNGFTRIIASRLVKLEQEKTK
jgi:CRISPR-associated protein (TIGR03984 family)